MHRRLNTGIIPEGCTKVEARVFFTPLEMKEESVRGNTVVVIDVLRASTTIVAALYNGARGVIPSGSLEAAAELVVKLGIEDVFLCAERDVRQVEGSDLGNSPSEYTEEIVKDRLLVLATTNGSGAILEARGASRVLIAGYVNAACVVASIKKEKEVVLLCAGNNGGFALEDAACAGMLLRRFIDETGEDILPLNDGAWVALELGRKTAKNPLRLLRRSAHGRYLDEEGFGSDLALCAAVDAWPVLPVLRDHIIVPSE